MKKISTLLACSLFISLHAQTTFFTENFGTGCSQNQEANGFNPSGVGVWTVTNTATNDPYANVWYISATESGMGVGNCGDGCLATGTTNRTLHMGSNAAVFGDVGAAYFSYSGVADTYKRAESPQIDCSLYNTIDLSFTYILGGVGGSDYFDVYYSSDGGSNWNLLASPSQTPTGVCDPQGQWAAFNVALPASANNNPNVKIGFRWQNLGSSGSDPSAAIDDVVLAGTSGGGPTITTGAITGAPFCAGASLMVPYTITGTFTAGNIFTAQLSDGSGSFASPTNIGTLSSTTAGSISCTIPSGTATGVAYLIRVIGSAPATIGSSSSAFTINALPTPTATNTGPYCAGATIQLNSPSGSATDDWAGPLSYSQTNTQNPTIASSTVAMSGVYTVTVTNGAGCSATATTTVAVNALPTPTASNTGPYCEGQTIQLNSPTGSATDDWTGPNSYVQNNMQNPTIASSTVAMSGVYTVTVTNGANCSATATTTVAVNDCSGIEDQGLINASLYPNPAADVFTISLPESTIDQTSVTILNLVGEVVYVFSPSQSKTSISSESLGLRSGIYLVQIKHKEESRVLRLVIR